MLDEKETPLSIADSELAPVKTARWAVIQELRKRGTARNREIARALDLKPSTVGYILYRLRIEGHARRVRMGLYEFISTPRTMQIWEELPQGDPESLRRAAEGDTMPRKILNLLAEAPGRTLSFRLLWKLTGLKRQVAGAVLSDLVKRGLVDRVHRGIYKLKD